MFAASDMGKTGSEALAKVALKLWNCASKEAHQPLWVLPLEKKPFLFGDVFGD